MEKWENFIVNWNNEFPDFQLTLDELKKPLSVMGALFQVLDRLGIDKDAVLMPQSEKDLNKHLIYYGDLIPVINASRVINHLMAYMPHAQDTKFSINGFLQPTVSNSYGLLMLPFNLMIFYEGKLREIAPYEEELYNVTNMVKTLEAKKNNLVEMLNRQAEEKAKRKTRMDQLAQDINHLEEELQAEEQLRDQEKQELDVLINETNVAEALVDQKKATKEGLMAELKRKRALRVYDADDIKTQAAQAVQSVQEAEEKLHSLGEVITQKENSLKILQMIKPNLDTANNLLHEITKMKDYEAGDLDIDSYDGELEVLTTELVELRAQESELSAARVEACRKRQECQAKRQEDKTVTESAVKEAEEKDKQWREFVVKAEQRTQEIKQLTLKYQEDKAKSFDVIQQMKKQYEVTVKEWMEALMKLVMDVKIDIENKESCLEDQS